MLKYYSNTTTKLLSETVNIGEKRLSNIERGHTIPNVYEAAAIAHFFDIPVQDLILNRLVLSSNKMALKNHFFKPNLRFLLKSYKISKAEFASLMGVKEKVVYRWIYHNDIPIIDTVTKIEQLFDLEKGSILSGFLT